MIICKTCAVEMRCSKTGVGADFGGGHVYAGDAYTCPVCAAEIVSTNQTAHFDPEYKFHDTYVQIQSVAEAALKRISQ